MDPRILRVAVLAFMAVWNCQLTVGPPIILADRNLSYFEVVKEYEGGVHLKAVNGQKISVSRVVDLAVYTACFPGNEEQWPVSKWKIQRVTVF